MRKENYEHRKQETERRIEQVGANIPELEREIKELRIESPLVAKKAEELRKKKVELGKIEEERNKLLTLRTELNSLKEMIRDKERQLARVSAESVSLVKQMEENSKLEYESERACINAIDNLGKELQELQKGYEEREKIILESEKRIGINHSNIDRFEDIKKKVSDIDTCPMCQTKIEKDHKDHVINEANNGIEKAVKENKELEIKLLDLKKEKKEIYDKEKELERKISNARVELVRHKTINDKREQLKKVLEEEKNLKIEVNNIEEKRRIQDI